MRFRVGLLSLLLASAMCGILSLSMPYCAIAEESSKEVSQEPSKEILQEVPKETSQESSKEASQETPQAALPESPKEISQEAPKEISQEPPKEPPKVVSKAASDYAVQFFRDYFYAPPELRQTKTIYNIENFVVFRKSIEELNSNFSVLTEFDRGITVTEAIKDARTVEEAKSYITSHVTSTKQDGVDVRALTIERKEGEPTTLFFIGNRGYASPEVAQAAIKNVKEIIEKEGGNFEEAVKAAEAAPTGLAAEQIVPVERPKPQYQIEEEIVLKVADWLGVGDHLYGKFYATPAGEQIVFQSFGETTRRSTNLDTPGFNDWVGYYCNRIVFRGIWTPIGDTTVDPYIEITPNLESNGRDYSSYLEVLAGFEWRPFHRNIMMQNEPMLDWMRNLRMFITYGNRYPLKLPYWGKRHDLEWGVEIYKEWGIDLPDIKESHPSDFWWSEVYSKLSFATEGFRSTDNNNCWIANSNIKIGIKWPRIPIPENLISDNVTFMPYFLFEHVENSHFRAWYENRLFCGAGLRVMPFRNYRYCNNEWLFKTRFFIEWIGINQAWYTKDSPRPLNGRQHDLRFGVGISYRRY